MVGERLRMLRKNKGITQTKLGEILGLHKSTLSLYEKNKGDMSDENKCKIAKYFNISLDYLLGLIDEEVCYYDDQKFLIYPKDMTSEEETLIREFIDFIYSRRKKRS